jgi:Ni,Fe-hydrogenase maturation factor
VLFVDCSTALSPGSVNIVEVLPAEAGQGQGTHHQGAPELLALALELYSSLPRNALLLTVGAGSIELGEEFSRPVRDAIPRACAKVEETVKWLLENAC